LLGELSKDKFIMVVKQPAEEGSVSNNAYEISGDPAGNRTQMTGLEDQHAIFIAV
jgi:hypothetical protein